MAVHGIQDAISAAAAGPTQAALRLSGVWHIHSISLQNEDAPAGEPGLILLQWGTDAYDAARTWHPLEIGTTRQGAPMIFECGFTVKGTVLIVGQVDHAAAAEHRLTVLAWKVRER